ncbi:MAG: efflux RND transporter permease subunit, partial [Muribaculaceae bacterium]|nr:efflux RND transporter permease subunit [Muribaculaceae bacterium]
MLNRIIRASLNQRVMVLILSGLVLILGMVLLLRTDVDIFPDLNAPTVVVMTEAPGYAPEEVEKLVTFPVETAVNGATDVRRVRSSSATGFSVVWVEFEWGTDTYRARQIVSEKLATIADKLPPGVKSPTLGPQSSILGEMMIIGLTADTTSLLDLRTYADRVIAPRLLSVGGVAQVSVIGGDVKEYQIQLDPERMRFHNVGIDEVIEAVDGMNNNTSGGVMYDYGNEYLIKADVSTTDPELLSQAVVRSDDNGIVKLADIATITIAAQSPRLGLASERGKPAVLITVTKQPATGTIALTERIEEPLASMKTNL